MSRAPIPPHPDDRPREARNGGVWREPPRAREYRVWIRRNGDSIFRWYWRVETIGAGFAFTEKRARKKARRAIQRHRPPERWTT